MKFIAILISIACLVSAQYNCPAYNCIASATEATSRILRRLDTGSTCLTYTNMINNTAQFSAGACTSSAPYCTLSMVSGNYSCNNAINAYNMSYPGEVCNNTNNCIGGGKCTSGICVGALAGASCQTDNNCDVGLFCNPISSQCSQLGQANSSCNSVNMCDSHLYCDPSTQICKLKGLLTPGTITPTRWACNTFYAVTLTNQKMCWIQPNNTDSNGNVIGDLIVNCTIGYQCNYSIPLVVNGTSNATQTYKKDCQCGYTAAGGNQGFCPPAQGNSVFYQNLSILLSFVLTSPRCHISSPLVCFSKTNLQNTNFNVSWVAANTLWDGVLYANNPPCVQQGVNLIYYYMAKNQYVPPQNNTPTPSGAAGFGAMAVLAALMIMV